MILRILEDYYDWKPDRRIPDLGWTKVRCPNPDHDDSQASATVSIEHDFVKCFACGLRKSGVRIVMDEEECSFDEAVDIISEYGTDRPSAVLPQPATREPGRRVFGQGARTPARRGGTVRPRVFRRD